MKKGLIFLFIAIVMLMSSCSNTSSEKESEQSTRVPNSVVGKWYENDEYEGIVIWDFNEKGIYYFASEDAYGKEDETFSIHRRKYSVVGNILYMDGEEVTVEYTSYGLRLVYDSGCEIKLYEYREDAVYLISDEYEEGEYYESIKDENGYVIIDNALVRCYTEDKELTIPDNITGIGSEVIVTELENIDKLTITGNVKIIGRKAFRKVPLGCVIIEEGAERIEEYAFAESYCKEIHIPESVKYIGERAFECKKGNDDGKIYVKKGSYAEKYLAQFRGNCHGAKIIVEE